MHLKNSQRELVMDDKQFVCWKAHKKYSHFCLLVLVTTVSSTLA